MRTSRASQTRVFEALTSLGSFLRRFRSIGERGMSPSKARVGVAVAVCGWLAYAFWALNGSRLVGAIVVAIGALIVNEVMIADERSRNKTAEKRGERNMTDVEVTFGPCCFCAQPISTTAVDPCSVTVSTRVDKWQVWHCHAACFKERLKGPPKAPDLFEPAHF